MSSCFPPFFLYFSLHTVESTGCFFSSFPLSHFHPLRKENWWRQRWCVGRPALRWQAMTQLLVCNTSPHQLPSSQWDIACWRSNTQKQNQNQRQIQKHLTASFHPANAMRNRSNFMYFYLFPLVSLFMNFPWYRLPAQLHVMGYSTPTVQYGGGIKLTKCKFHDVISPFLFQKWKRINCCIED